MIFAAGLGTRLKPLTDTMPKALVPVGGSPLLELTIDRLVSSGATEIVVNVHHFGEQIIAYINQHNWKVPVRISDEREALLDTGGGLLKAGPLFQDEDGPILIHNVDILSNADLSALYKAGCSADCILLVSERQTQRYLLFDDDMRLCGWTNLATKEVRSPYPNLDLSKMHRFAFSGIHTFSPQMFRLMDGFPNKFGIMDFYLSVCHKANIRAFLQKDLRLLDVGKQDTIQTAEAFLKEIKLYDHL